MANRIIPGLGLSALKTDPKMGDLLQDDGVQHSTDRDYRCVRCGKEISEEDFRVMKSLRWCAPSCWSCRSLVVAETQKQFSMWPNDYHGGYLWSANRWHWHKR